MKRNTGIMFCLSYGFGLLLTGFFGFPNPNPSWQQWLGVIVLIILSIGAMMAIPSWRRSLGLKVFLIAGVIALLGAIHLQMRLPRPAVNDISWLSAGETVTVTGKVLTESRLTRGQKWQMWLEVKESESDGETRSNTGKLYVTLPDSEENRVYPGQEIRVKGSISRLKAATNPGTFDFKSYLAARGCFARLRGMEIIDKTSPSRGLWQLRRRIVESLTEGLNSEYGSLLSSITLGRQAADLSPEIEDLFVQTGLTHVLAVSGFHIALLLGVTLKLTRNLSPRQQFFIGMGVLIFYVGLTGIQPSIMRAALMGVAGLIGLIYNRKVNSYGALIVAATILLLFNPLWIFDLGFALSFLATLGLIISVKPIEERLNYLPSLIAEPVAITLAASLWTLPLLLYSFSSFAVYSLPVNIITTPLISLISLGGVISAALALIYPPLGSLSASFLYYPIKFLLAIVSWFANLPASFYAVGKLSLGAMVLIYGLLGLTCWLKSLQKRWYLVGLLIISLICLPIVYNRLTWVQVIVFDSRRPVVVIQDRGAVVLVNGNDSNSFKYSVLPFLQQQGINTIDVAMVREGDVSSLEKYLRINQTLSTNDRQNIRIGALFMESFGNGLLKWQLHDSSWLLIEDKKTRENISSLNAEVILWAGRSLPSHWLDRVNPRVAIAVSKSITDKTHQRLAREDIDIKVTGRDGAIIWTPRKGFEKFLDTDIGW